MPAASAPSPGRSAHAAVLALTVAVFAIVVGVVTWQLRAGLREQMLRNFAERLAAVATMQLDNYSVDIGPVEQMPDGIYVAVLKTTKLRGVAGMRVYDAEGNMTGDWMVPRSEERPLAPIWNRIVGGQAIGILRLQAERNALELPLAPMNEPVVEAWVPLRTGKSPQLLGAAQFWIESNELLADLAKHDQRLWTQAGIAWFAGSVVIALTLGAAFRRLDAANRELRTRSEDLQRANRELVLAAKTSALGAVTAHLMHELKSPLAGLEMIVAGQSDPGARAEAGGGELAAASELTRRLRTMVNDVVGVLRDEQTGAEFELTCADVVELAAAKVQPEARQRGVTLKTAGAADIVLPGRRANLALLVVRNLLQNALEATPVGGTVRVGGRGQAGGGVEFLVEDSGAGLPGPVRERLFQPCQSTKAGGSGLGLALSYQLAQHAGGRLELIRSDDRGTSFRLVLMQEA